MILEAMRGRKGRIGGLALASAGLAGALAACTELPSTSGHSGDTTAVVRVSDLKPNPDITQHLGPIYLNLRDAHPGTLTDPTKGPVEVWIHNKGDFPTGPEAKGEITTNTGGDPKNWNSAYNLVCSGADVKFTAPTAVYSIKTLFNCEAK